MINKKAQYNLVILFLIFSYMILSPTHEDIDNFQSYQTCSIKISDRISQSLGLPIGSSFEVINREIHQSNYNDLCESLGLPVDASIEEILAEILEC